MACTLAIVDDEQIVRNSLASIIDWHSLGISLLFTAKDGQDALTLMEKEVPDILLTDIKMPHMNGIELAMHVRTRYPSCHVIFLSGYTDKAYLKTAIHLKIESYIEKPVDVDELYKTMRGLASTICQGKPAPGDQPLILSNFAVTSYLVKQEIAVELITMQSGGYDTVHSRFFPLYFSWGKKDIYHIICIYPHIPDTPDAPTLSVIQDWLYASLDKPQAGSRLDYFLGQIDTDAFGLILRAVDPGNLSDILRQLQKHISNNLHVMVSMGISKPVEDALYIPHAWKQAKALCQRWFYLGKGILVDSETPHPEHLVPVLPPSWTEDLPATYRETRELFTHLEKTWVEDIDALQEVLYRLYISMMDRTINSNTMNREDFKKLTLQETAETVLYGMHVLSTLGNDQYDPKIKQAIHYILWNYADQNLSIPVIAGNVGITQNYLCALFKQNTGITINTFVGEVRIEKTKKLLRSTDLRLYEIAWKVGVPDANYLSSMFKKICGMTPSQYRDAVHKGRENI